MDDLTKKLTKTNDLPAFEIPPPKEPAPSISTAEVPTESTENTQPIESKPSGIEQLFALDQAKPLETGSFPNQPPRGSYQVPATIPNVKYLLASYGISVRYNVIKKKPMTLVPGLSGAPDNVDGVALTQIISLASMNGMSVGQVPSILDAIGDRNQHNPVADWINSKPWDGIDRLQDFYATLTCRDDYPEPLKDRLIYRWLISAVAAAFMSSGFRGRGVLTLQGPQSIGKTAWVNALVPGPILRESVVKLDHHLDASNKDSLLTAISHWIVEIGELDSSFKKDIARLKGFLTGNQDKIRQPYARANSEYARRTVFCATVNDHDFLVDSTGNTRWWVIPVEKINYQHGIDMQQLFAQIAVDFNAGEQWWLDRNEEKCLEINNKEHRSASAIRELILSMVDLEPSNNNDQVKISAGDMLREIGIDKPTNPQFKECNAVLRELFGDSKRIKGINKWSIPKKIGTFDRLLSIPDDD